MHCDFYAAFGNLMGNIWLTGERPVEVFSCTAESLGFFVSLWRGGAGGIHQETRGRGIRRERERMASMGKENYCKCSTKNFRYQLANLSSKWTLKMKPNSTEYLSWKGPWEQGELQTQRSYTSWVGRNDSAWSWNSSSSLWEARGRSWKMLEWSRRFKAAVPKSNIFNPSRKTAMAFRAEGPRRSHLAAPGIIRSSNWTEALCLAPSSNRRRRKSSAGWRPARAPSSQKRPVFPLGRAAGREY